MEQEPTNLREYAIAKQRALVVSLRDKLAREETVLYNLMGPKPPIVDGLRPSWQGYIERMGVIKQPPNETR